MPMPMSITMSDPTFISTRCRVDPVWWFGWFGCGLPFDLYDGSNGSLFGNRWLCALIWVRTDVDADVDADYDVGSDYYHFYSIPIGFDLMVSLVLIWITTRLLWRYEYWLHLGWDSYWNNIWFDFAVDAEVDVAGSIFGLSWNQMVSVFQFGLESEVDDDANFDYDVGPDVHFYWISIRSDLMVWLVLLRITIGFVWR